jgi:peroxiredoxin
MTSTSTRHPRHRGTPHPSAKRTRKAAQRRLAHRRAAIGWSIAVVVFAAVVTAMLLASRPTSSSTAGAAPSFTLQSTDGKTVSLADYRGKNVVLYFNEGVGCGACFYQMRDIEQHAADLANAGVTVLPVVMNPADQVRQEMARYGLRTPYLIDADGSVSRAYGTIGKGMHAGLPGHSFVLIDKTGVKRWYGEYPSMYLPTAQLLQQVSAHLGA